MPFQWVRCSLEKPRSNKIAYPTGFALPLAIALGLVMIAFAGTSILVAQNTRNNAIQRRTLGASILVSDGAISRALLELSKPNNGVLLIRNYDPIDSRTGKNYLGADGTPKSGDEGGTAVNQWSGYDPSNAPCFQQLGRTAPNIALTGTIGTDETYIIRAYRYDKQNKQGTLLVEGSYRGQSSLVAVTLTIEPVLDDFPGIALINTTNTTTTTSPGVLALRGRQVLGGKANVYYMSYNSADPTLTGSSASGDSTRPSYLNALRSSGAQDGASGDTIAGKIFSCRLRPSIPPGAVGTNLGVINTSQTLRGVRGKAMTFYQAEQIDLAGNEVLTVDTTNGPVQIDIIFNSSWQGIILHNDAKILNIRTDGQSPQVGDLRIVSQSDSRVVLYDKTCIQNAFLWFAIDELRLLTTGPGCPGGQNTNIEGVLWMEAVLSAKNSASNRAVSYLGLTGQDYDTTVISGTTSGIAVPDDLASLSDLLEYVDWPARYRYGTIKKWQRVS